MTNQVTTQNNKKAITDTVLTRVNDLTKNKQLVIPKNYAVQNALKSAFLILQETKDKNKKCVLQSCTQASIANALLDMVIQGLSPVKKQCYFIPHGNQLSLFRSYMGTIMAAKRSERIEDVKAYCIYEGDEFDYEYNPTTGYMKVTKYKPLLTNMDPSKLIGAFAVVIGENDVVHTEFMSIAQIRTAWAQGPTKGKSPSHLNFPDQMAKRTVINRACKLYINTGDDNDIFAEAFNRTFYADDEEINQVQDKVIQDEIDENANKKIIDVEELNEEVIPDEDFNEEIEETENELEVEEAPF